MIGKIFIK